VADNPLPNRAWSLLSGCLSLQTAWRLSTTGRRADRFIRPLFRYPGIFSPTGRPHRCSPDQVAPPDRKGRFSLEPRLSGLPLSPRRKKDRGRSKRPGPPHLRALFLSPAARSTFWSKPPTPCFPFSDVKVSGVEKQIAENRRLLVSDTFHIEIGVGKPARRHLQQLEGKRTWHSFGDALRPMGRPGRERRHTNRKKNHLRPGGLVAGLFSAKSFSGLPMKMKASRSTPARYTITPGCSHSEKFCRHQYHIEIDLRGQMNGEFLAKPKSAASALYLIYRRGLFFFRRKVHHRSDGHGRRRENSRASSPVFKKGTPVTLPRYYGRHGGTEFGVAN